MKKKCVGTRKMNLFPNVFNDAQNKWNAEYNQYK